VVVVVFVFLEVIFSFFAVVLYVLCFLPILIVLVSFSW